MRDTCDLWPVCGPNQPIAPSRGPHSDLVMPVDLRFLGGAGEGNRTLMTSLEGCVYTGYDLHQPRWRGLALVRE